MDNADVAYRLVAVILEHDRPLIIFLIGIFFQPILDYNEKKMKLDAQLVLTITIGRAICLALRALVRFLKLWLNKKKAVSNT